MVWDWLEAGTQDPSSPLQSCRGAGHSRAFRVLAERKGVKRIGRNVLAD